MNQSGRSSQRNLFAKAALYTLVGCMALVSCNGKDRPVPSEPTPPPTPSPTPSGEIRLALSLTSGGVISDGKLVNEWKTNDEVKLWGITKDGNKALPLVAKRLANGQWSVPSTPADEWKSVERVAFAYLPSPTNNYNPTKDTFQPPMGTNKVIGAFRLSHYYNDLLIGEVQNPQKQISTTLSSPYKQV